MNVKAMKTGVREKENTLSVIERERERERMFRKKIEKMEERVRERLGWVRRERKRLKAK